MFSKLLAPSLNFDPVMKLLNRHNQHQQPYEADFKGLKLVMYPEVFNPSYTKVSGFLADNISIPENSEVLDMFTGSGAVAFVASQTASKVTGIDISQPAIDCALENIKRLDLSSKIEMRRADLWAGVLPDEQFNVITANPPLLPVTPSTLLEQAIADSPDMQVTKRFLHGCASHLKPNGKVYMAFSNACQAYLSNPLDFINTQAQSAKLDGRVKAEWDVGYEVYRVIEFSHLKG